MELKEEEKAGWGEKGREEKALTYRIKGNHIPLESKWRPECTPMYGLQGKERRKRRMQPLTSRIQ